MSLSGFSQFTCFAMPSGKLGSYLNLHLIVFIWGFTAILGELITLRDDTLPGRTYVALARPKMAEVRKRIGLGR